MDSEQPLMMTLDLRGVIGGLPLLLLSSCDEARDAAVHQQRTDTHTLKALAGVPEEERCQCEHVAIPGVKVLYKVKANDEAAAQQWWPKRWLGW